MYSLNALRETFRIALSAVTMRAPVVLIAAMLAIPLSNVTLLASDRGLTPGSLGGCPAGGRLLPSQKLLPASYTQTGFDDDYWYYTNNPSPSQPLLVCWHQYSNSGNTVYQLCPDLLATCAARGWAYLSFTGPKHWNGTVLKADHFGYPVAQRHCGIVIHHLIHVLGVNVDPERIYMCGSSMGGGGAASYATRHHNRVDDFNPQQDIFPAYPVAGLILVSSPLDWVDAFFQADLGAQRNLLQLMYEGIEDPWHPWCFDNLTFHLGLRGISALDLLSDPPTPHAKYWHMATNLKDMPVFITYGEKDIQVPYVPDHNEVLYQYLSGLGCDVRNDYIPGGTLHGWTVLDRCIADAFDHIDPALNNYDLGDFPAYASPYPIDIVADRDARFHWATIARNDPAMGELYLFARVKGSADASASPNPRLVIDEADQLYRLEVDCDHTGLHDPANIRDIDIDYFSSCTVHGQQELVLHPISQAPNDIWDNDLGQSYSGNWSHDATAETLTITIATPAELDLTVRF